MSQICNRCSKRNKCEYAHATWKNCTLFPDEHCAKEIKEASDYAYEILKDKIGLLEGNIMCQGIEKQFELIMNVALNITE